MHETRELTLEDMTPRYLVSVQTDAGCIREVNEDSGRHITPNDADTLESKGTLTLIADGMGGHASGEVASQMAIDMISEVYYGEKRRSAPAALTLAIEQANAAIYHAAVSDPDLSGMGTTVVALVLKDGHAFSAHVGDSRLYRLRARRLELMTTDHSEVMEMVRNGLLTTEQARYHEDKNVILRAVGTQPTVNVEVSNEFSVEYGDSFLLCSDGLNDMIDDREIEAIMAGYSDAHSATRELIAAAKRSGGHDNITVGVIRVSTDNGAIGRAPITRELEAAEA